MENKKAKVLHLIKSLGRGGAEKLLPETLKLHNREEFELHYIYFLPWKNQLVEELQEQGVVVKCFSAASNFRILAQIGKVLQYVKQHNFDVIHCHLPWAGFVGRILYKLTTIPVLYTEHNKQERYHPATYLLNKWTFNFQREAIAVSDDVAKSIVQKIKPRITVRTIVNGVNTSEFKRNLAEGGRIKNSYHIPPDAIVIGTISVFRSQKRLPEWLQVAQAIRRKYEHVYFVIVGDGPLKKKVLEAKELLGLDDRVILPGLQENVKPWLSAIDIFMMTSKFEGLPVALLEAMSMECSVASTDAGGIKEVVQHSVNGLLVPVEGWKQLEGEVVKLIEDEALRLRIARAGRRRIEERFGLNTMVRSLEILYRELSAEGK